MSAMISPSGYASPDAQAWRGYGAATKQAASVAGMNMLPQVPAQAPVQQAPPASVASVAVIGLVLLIVIRALEHYAGRD